MKNNLEKNLKNIPTLPTPQGLELENSRKWFSFSNVFLFTLTLIQFGILTYFYTQKDIIFNSTGWVTLPEKFSWYNIFLIFIFLRMLMVFITRQLAEYIKNFTLWSEKKKKNSLLLLTLINLLTTPINLPLMGTFYAYLQGKEILSKNVFLGTFRRILSKEEREKMYQETVQNFLDKMETSKNIQAQVKTWAMEKTQFFLERYDAGSDFATKYLSEKLANQKEFFQLEELKKLIEALQIQDLVDKTAKDPQGWGSWTFDQTLKGLNLFNPYVTEFKICVAAWVGLLGTGAIFFILAKSNVTVENHPALNHPALNHLALNHHELNLPALHQVIEDFIQDLQRIPNGVINPEHDVERIIENANNHITFSHIINEWFAFWTPSLLYFSTTPNFVVWINNFNTLDSGLSKSPNPSSLPTNPTILSQKPPALNLSRIPSEVYQQSGVLHPPTSDISDWSLRPN